jgi:23S rRNA (guanine745-N1)-methyltransferase
VPSLDREPGAGDPVRHLRCPVCRQPLDRHGQALGCPAGHRFDVARQGHVTLLAGRAPHQGDSAEMVAAREEFLAAGHYDVISTALAAVAAGAPGAYPDLVVDAGAGTGRHLAAVLDARPAADGLALDVSKPALRRAARAHPRAMAVLCDTWRALPVADRSAAVLLNVFAPRNGSEFRRVLRTDGLVLVVTPTAAHLAELVGALGLLRVDPAKSDRVAASLAGHFEPVGGDPLRWRVRLTRREVSTLVGMGPSAWHTGPDRLAVRVAALSEPVEVTASVELTVYRPRPGG